MMTTQPTPDTLEEFCCILKTVQTRHTNVVQTMAQGVLELKESHTVDNQTDMAIQVYIFIASYYRQLFADIKRKILIKNWY